MKHYVFTYLLTLLFGTTMVSQELPYGQIPEYPQNYAPGNVLARMIDGLGYRYFWATKDLGEGDLNFSPVAGGRDLKATLEHIYSMSFAFVSTAQGEAYEGGIATEGLSLEALRKGSLLNFKQASETFSNKTEQELEALALIFKRGDKETKFPLWHLMNGQISDCIYHTGQIVMLRRMNGNPIDPKVNVFMGKNRD